MAICQGNLVNEDVIIITKKKNNNNYKYNDTRKK